MCGGFFPVICAHITIAAEALGSPFVLAALALVRKLPQNLDRAEMGAFAGNRTIAAAPVAAPVAASSERGAASRELRGLPLGS